MLVVLKKIMQTLHENLDEVHLVNLGWSLSAGKRVIFSSEILDSIERKMK